MKPQPYLTGVSEAMPKEFQMLKEIFEQQVFELCIQREESGAEVFCIPYMMNDALECYLILEDCRMTGSYQEKQEEELSAHLEERDGSYGLIVRQGQTGVFTLWFRQMRQVLRCYQYHAIGHFWAKGQEQWRRLVYILGTIYDKYQYLGESVCSEKEQELLFLAEFAPLRLWSALGHFPDSHAGSSLQGIEAMRRLAKEANDRAYLRLLAIYERFPYSAVKKLLGRALTSPSRIPLYLLLEEKIHIASEEYRVRNYGSAGNLEIQRQREEVDRAIRCLGFQGAYPEYRRENLGVVAMEEHPFTVMEAEEFEFRIQFMVSVSPERELSRNEGFFRGRGRTGKIAKNLRELEQMLTEEMKQNSR